MLCTCCGPGSSIGIATDYGLDGPGSSQAATRHTPVLTVALCMQHDTETQDGNLCDTCDFELINIMSVNDCCYLLDMY